jgi:hypothetical protein
MLHEDKIVIKMKNEKLIMKNKEGKWRKEVGERFE